MEIQAEAERGMTLSRLLDYFIPAEMRVNTEAHRRARMFMLSHMFGPVLGNTLPAYLYVMNISRDYRVVVFFLSILAFWIYPFVLRWTKRYQMLAIISVQNLIFCALWACYSYGGLSSPFLPWLLIFPLLAFLYLPPTGWIRNVLLIQIFGSVAGFTVVMLSGVETPAIDLKKLQVIGMLSMASVAIYFAMMSLYFAKMFHEQRSFTRELNALVSTSDNVRNLTASANQASAAKANFVASMSHELRTPLNAIIGYSQLLIEEAIDEEDDQSVADLKHVYQAGTDLLRLIDDILDYSRIDAGKMPLLVDIGSPLQHLEGWLADISARGKCADRAVNATTNWTPDALLQTDWSALGHSIRHACAAIASQREDGSIALSFDMAGNDLEVSIVDLDTEGRPRIPVAVDESFDHQDDASASKYGGTGIEIALASKFAALLGGSLVRATDPAGRIANRLHIPDLSAPDRSAVPAAA